MARLKLVKKLKSDITGVFEDNGDVGCARYRCAMARIGSDREARSETREGACSPRATIDRRLLGGCFFGGCACVFHDDKSVISGVFVFFRWLSWVFWADDSWHRDGAGTRSRERARYAVFHGVKCVITRVFDGF